MNFAPRYLVNNFKLFKHSNKQVVTYMLKAMLHMFQSIVSLTCNIYVSLTCFSYYCMPCSWMHDGAYVHDVQMLNACVTPGCYTHVRKPYQNRSHSSVTSLTSRPRLVLGLAQGPSRGQLKPVAGTTKTSGQKGKKQSRDRLSLSFHPHLVPHLSSSFSQISIYPHNHSRVLIRDEHKA
jgi:hypothetical protein